MADNRIPSGAPAATTAPPTSTGAAAPQSPAKNTAAAAPQPQDTGRVVPKNWAESLQAAASLGQQVLKEGFNQGPARQPAVPANVPQPQQPIVSQQDRFPPTPDMSTQRIANPTNPASFSKPRTMFDLANVSMSSYGGGPDQGKIALYSAGKTPDGKPVVLVDITGTEFDFSGNHSNLPTNWGAAGSGRVTDLELQVVGAIQDAYKRGDIPQDAVIDLTGHSLGAIVANNVSGRPNAQGEAGKIAVTGPDGAKSELPIRNVIGFGTPKPSIWSNDVNYIQRVGYADIVSNLATDEVNGTRLNQWAREPGGPQIFDRQRVHLHIPSNDVADGGHLQYNKRPNDNPLADERLPPTLQYSDGLKLISAYKNPALGEAPPADRTVSELQKELLSPRLQRDMDIAFPQWRTWLGAETDEKLSKLPPGVRNQIGISLEAVFETYLDSDRFKAAGPAERREILKQDEARLKDVVKKIATPLASELARQTVVDWWKDNVKLPWK